MVIYNIVKGYQNNMGEIGDQSMNPVCSKCEEPGIVKRLLFVITIPVAIKLRCLASRGGEIKKYQPHEKYGKRVVGNVIIYLNREAAGPAHCKRTKC